MPFPIKAIQGLDHIDLRVQDIMSVWTEWQRLGFLIAPPSLNKVEGVASCAVALADDTYIAISGPVAEGEAHRSVVAAGFNAALLRVNDRDRAVDEMNRAGLPIKEVFEFSRDVEMDGGTATITFRLASLDASDSSNDIDEIMLIEHVTPQYIWRENMMDHSNGVKGLHQTVLMCREPLALQELYSRLLGPDHVKRMDNGGLAVDCGNATILYLPETKQSQPAASGRQGELHVFGAQSASEAALPGGAGRIFFEVNASGKTVRRPG